MDWRLGNFNNVTLYIPQRSLTPKALLSTAQSQNCVAKHVPFPSLYNTGRQFQQTREVWGNPAVSRPRKQTLVSRRKATLPGHSSADTEGRHHPARRATANQCCTRLTTEFGMQPGMTQNTAHHFVRRRKILSCGWLSPGNTWGFSPPI